jgi:hypothetical protein
MSFSSLSTRARRCQVLCLVAAFVTAVAASAPQAVKGTWRAQPIVVDGLTGDWQPLMLLEGGPDVGAVNDGEFLHLAVSTKDPDLAGLLASGLIVWIDPAGRRAQTFGIWVPGIELTPLPGANPAPSTTPAPGTFATRVLDRFDILGPGRNQRRLVDLTPELGIELAHAYSDSEVIYEMKIPLQKTATRPYAVGALTGRPVGLGLATPTSPRNTGARQRLVGSDGFIGGNPFRGGGFASYRQPDGSVKPLEVWTTLTLAVQP